MPATPLHHIHHVHHPLTRARLRDLIDCPRRFWLGTVIQLPWPAAPLPSAVEKSTELGQQFHRLMRRHFLGLEPKESELAPEIRAWWAAWQNHPFPLGPGRLLPEVTLAIPSGKERLLARYDLVLLPAKDDEKVLILDWKTEGRPRSREELATDMQTRLYPYILAAGGAALASHTAQATAIAPGRIEMIYWQANDPAKPTRFPYSAGAHAANQTYFERLAAQATALHAANEPAPIDNLTICERCPYATYCGLDLAPNLVPSVDEDDEPMLYPELEPFR